MLLLPTKINSKFEIKICINLFDIDESYYIYIYIYMYIRLYMHLSHYGIISVIIINLMKDFHNILINLCVQVQ